MCDAASFLFTDPIFLVSTLTTALASRCAAMPSEIFMTKRMLIDAVHPEETRVVVLNNNQIDEFDFESSTKSPLRGNIYLAKVTRVEPSLQAAFVE